jgi:hypothetical protein
MTPNPSPSEPTSGPTREPVQEKKGAERRRWPRANADLPIDIALDGTAQRARVRDVSRAGVCFYLERPVPLMTVLGVELDASQVASGRKIRGQGAVVRCAKISPHVSHYEIALFFHDMSDTDRASLDALVRLRLAAV